MTRFAMAMVVLLAGLLALAATAGRAEEPGDERAEPDEKTELEVGEKLPAFKLKNQDGKWVTHEDAARGRWLVLAFFPKAGTPG